MPLSVILEFYANRIISHLGTYVLDAQKFISTGTSGLVPFGVTIGQVRRGAEAILFSASYCLFPRDNTALLLAVVQARPIFVARQVNGHKATVVTPKIMLFYYAQT